MTEGTATVSIDGGPEIPLEELEKSVAGFKETQARRWLSGQPTLSDELFPAIKPHDVPMIKVAISGTVEMTRDVFLALLRNEDDEPAGSLDAGDELRLSAAGFCLQPGAAWVKRKEKLEDGDTEEWWEREGRVKVKLMELARLQTTGEKWSE